MSRKHKLPQFMSLIMAIAAVAVIVHILGVKQTIIFVHDWIDSFGVWAPVVFFAIYVVGTVFIVPISVLTIAAGVMLGDVTGMIVASAASTIGGGLCFLISRYLAREHIKRILEKHGRFRKLDEMTRKYGAHIVAASRIVFIFPGAVLNYGFGLTKVKFSTFIIWSWIGMIPEIIAYVVGTNVIYRMVVNHKVHWHNVLMLISVIVFIVAVTIHTKRLIARNFAASAD